VKFQMDKKFII